MIQDAATELPKGMELVDLMSIKSFWDASVHNVIETLLEAQPAGYFHREALPARPAFHGDSRRGYCCIIDWNICFSLFCRNVRQHADAICAGTCYRYGGGRCDCCGRSYAVPLRQRLPFSPSGNGGSHAGYQSPFGYHFNGVHGRIHPGLLYRLCDGPVLKSLSE